MSLARQSVPVCVSSLSMAMCLCTVLRLVSTFLSWGFLPSEVLSGYSDGEGELLNYRCNSINLVMKIACMTTDCHEMKETGARDRQLSTKSVSLRNMATR